MLFDTHCHLNFSRFKKNVDEVITRATDQGVTHIVVPGTDVATSQKAIEIANTNNHIYAAVGIHPHHVYEFKTEEDAANALTEIEKLLESPKVVAVGEVGLDRHIYTDTKYEGYAVDEHFIALQNSVLQKQMSLAVKHHKSLILHNREARHDMVTILNAIWDSSLEYRAVFHCCEPDTMDVSLSLLDFAKKHHLFIGIDGDISYQEDKKEWIKTVPLEMLVLETDSPFLLPEPLRAEKRFPNEPMNITIVAEIVAKVKGVSVDVVTSQTFENACQLFNLQNKKLP